MKAFKIVMALVLLIIVLGVGAFVYLASNLNGIVEDVIESEGPKVTQTEVTVDNVDIQLRKGRGEIADFTVANPREFDSPNALHASKLVLQVEPSSVVDEVIVVREVLVEGVTITAEQKGLTTNIQSLLKSIREATASEQEPATEAQSDVRLMVEKLTFADSRLQLITEQHGRYELDMPELELSDIGSREEGLTPAQLGRAVLEPAFAQARQAAQQKLEDAARGEAESRLKEKAREKLGEDAEEKLKNLRGLFE